MIKVQKYLNCVSPRVMIIFKLRKNTYNLRNFESLNPRTKHCGLHCIAYRTSQIRETAPIEIRDSIWLKFSNIK